MASTIRQIECKKIECPHCGCLQQTVIKFGEKIKCVDCNKMIKLNKKSYVCKVNHISCAMVKIGEEKWM